MSRVERPSFTGGKTTIWQYSAPLMAEITWQSYIKGAERAAFEPLASPNCTTQETRDRKSPRSSYPPAFEVLFSPSAKREKDGLESTAVPREGVNHFGRHLGMYCAAQESIFLQFAQRLGQHFLGGFGQTPAKLAETPRAWLEIIEHQRFPSPTHDAHGMGHRTVF